MLRKLGRMTIIYLALGAIAAFVFMRLPTSFMPNEDQGNLMMSVQLPVVSI